MWSELKRPKSGFIDKKPKSIVLELLFQIDFYSLVQNFCHQVLTFGENI